VAAAAKAAAPAAPPAVAQHRSYLQYGEYRFLKIALGLCVASAIAYVAHDPPHGPSGDTWLGYALGGIGAALILWLAWYGVRKRQFRRGTGMARAWVSAHVYLGLACLFVVTLHTAFAWGWNLHTLAYVLLWLVVASGGYGIGAYALLPTRISENRQHLGPRVMLQEIAKLEEAALRLADGIDAETHQIVVRSVERVRIGGTVWQQLTGRYPAPGADRSLDDHLKRKRGEMAAAVRSVQPSKRQATMMFVADQLFDSGRAARGEGLKRLLDTLARRNALVARLNRDITLRARLEIWLYVHVPLACALLAAVVAHVLSVFLYR
jgi:hypothetical protein